MFLCQSVDAVEEFGLFSHLKADTGSSSRLFDVCVACAWSGRRLREYFRVFGLIFSTVDTRLCVSLRIFLGISSRA